MAWLLMAWGVIGGYSIINTAGDTLTQKQWAGLAGCAVLLIVGALLQVLGHGDD